MRITEPTLVKMSTVRSTLLPGAMPVSKETKESIALIWSYPGMLFTIPSPNETSITFCPTALYGLGGSSGILENACSSIKASIEQLTCVKPPVNSMANGFHAPSPPCARQFISTRHGPRCVIMTSPCDGPFLIPKASRTPRTYGISSCASLESMATGIMP